MKKFIFNIILLIFPFALVIALTNYLVDPANVFSNGSYENNIASVLLKGHNIDNVQNCDDRIFLEKMITQSAIKPNVVILGSSRAMEIPSSFFREKKFLNCGVSHANMNDFLAIVGIFDSIKKFPEEIYIETSPLLIERSPTDEWTSLIAYHQRIVKKMNLDLAASFDNTLFSYLQKKASALFSFQYFQKSIVSINKIRQRKFTDVDTLVPKHFGRMTDCSLTYPYSYTHPDTAKAIVDADTYVSKSVLPNIDETKLKILQKLIAYLKQQNVKIDLVNTPFQPDCYKIFEGKYHSFSTITNKLSLLSKSEGIPLIGTFNPATANLNRSQFYDQLHCSKQALEAVFKIIN